MRSMRRHAGASTISVLIGRHSSIDRTGQAIIKLGRAYNEALLVTHCTKSLEVGHIPFTYGVHFSIICGTFRNTATSLLIQSS